MNVKVEAYLATKERETEAKKQAYRKKILQKAGLVEKIFSPHPQSTQEYPYYDEDEMRYYKLVYEEVTEEEFERIEAYASQEADSAPEEGKMFASIGSKLKSVAMMLCWIGIALSVLAGLVLLAQDGENIFVALLTGAVGSVVSWVSSLVLYGFGELIVKVTEIERNTKK